MGAGISRAVAVALVARIRTARRIASGSARDEHRPGFYGQRETGRSEDRLHDRVACPRIRRYAEKPAAISTRARVLARLDFAAQREERAPYIFGTANVNGHDAGSHRAFDVFQSVVEKQDGGG